MSKTVIARSETTKQSTWRECKLGDVGCSVLSGYAFKSSDFKESGIPLIKIGNLQNKVAKIDINGNFLSDDILDNKVSKFLLEDEDILIAMTGQGSVGRIAKLILQDNQKALLNQRVGKFVCDEINIHKKYLYYVLSSNVFQDYLFNAGIGSGQPNLSPEIILQTEIPYCNFEEQKAIAEVLSSLDDKIDLLHRQNKTLEEMAQTLFRQWFIEEARNDWKIGTLNDIMQFNPTHSLKKGGMHPFLEMGNVQTFKSSVADWYKRAFTSGTKFKNGDTLLARITPSLENGKTAYVDFLEGDEIGWGSTEFIVMRMKKDFHPFISYLIARNEDFRDFAIGNMTGSTGRQRAQVKDIKEYEIAIPPIEIIQKLNESIKHIPIKIRANAKQIKTLENLRDTLLPKLMSGEVRVKI